jgi:hypothetical protein
MTDVPSFTPVADIALRQAKNRATRGNHSEKPGLPSCWVGACMLSNTLAGQRQVLLFGGRL